MGIHISTSCGTSKIHRAARLLGVPAFILGGYGYLWLTHQISFDQKRPQRELLRSLCQLFGWLIEFGVIAWLWHSCLCFLPSAEPWASRDSAGQRSSGGTLQQQRHVSDQRRSSSDVEQLLVLHLAAGYLHLLLPGLKTTVCSLWIKLGCNSCRIASMAHVIYIIDRNVSFRIVSVFPGTVGLTHVHRLV